MTPKQILLNYLCSPLTQNRLPKAIIEELQIICQQDDAPLDPLMFGTLFQKTLHPEKRHQEGVHYTQRHEIELIVDAVLMEPLLNEWAIVGQEFCLSTTNRLEASATLQAFASKIANTRVLDPACGSGNFLYIALQKLLDLQKEVMTFAERYGLPAIPLTVDPQQLHGMEINIYAHELAQVTVWIGYIQWRYENGLWQDFGFWISDFGSLPNPKSKIENRKSLLDTIKRMDAILAYDEQGNPVEPEWVAADVIIGNPPFLGSKRMRSALGDKYCNDLLKVYKQRINGMPDLVCYWFDKAQVMVANSKAKTVGLLATQAIRGGTNRQVLERIVKDNRIFMAWSDREWLLAGATVHVSLIGFDNGNGRKIRLNGREVAYINADLTTGVDLIQAQKLTENVNLSFQGAILRGQFNLDAKTAQTMLNTQNRCGLNNQAVIKRHSIARDITGRMTNDYVVDFGVDMSESEAKKYELPYQYVKTHVYPTRQQVHQKMNQELWWLHGGTTITMRQAIRPLKRYIATPRVGKHRLFVWLEADILPDTALVVFAREDDYFFGVLHSKWHELWARRMGTQLRDAVSGFRYTSTTTFQTFPFPYPPGHEPSETDSPIVKGTADYARQLVQFRDNWLNPSADDIGASVIKKRTLTNLYNALNYYREVKPGHENDWGAGLAQIFALGNISAKLFLSLAEIETLDWIHTHLDQSVLDAYGWGHDLNDEQILENLLALNLERANSPFQVAKARSSSS